jgi:thiol-disulfide isomerase/thioredoxin
MRHVLLACVLLLAAVAQADEGALQPFQRGSAKAVIEARAGRPFILTFWSVDCVHCRGELALLSALSRAHPELEVVLVSTDTPAAAAEIDGVLRQYTLPRAERWVFADDFTERLRFEVDPRWHGELPRTYLHGPGKTVEGISGKLSEERVNRWLQATQEGGKHARH